MSNTTSTVVRTETDEIGTILEYDINGNLVHEVSSTGAIETWYEYDSNGNLVHKKETFTIYDSSCDFNYWWSYDECGRLIHYEESNGCFENHEYIKDMHYIYRQEKNGEVTHYWYDNQKRLVYIETSTGEKMKIIYGNGFKIVYHGGENRLRSRTLIAGNSELTIDMFGECELREYDDIGHKIHTKSTNIKYYSSYTTPFHESWFKYDEEGFCIHIKTNPYSGKIREEDTHEMFSLRKDPEHWVRYEEVQYK